MIKVNALGDTCPIPVVKTKNAIQELQGSGRVETLVDNEIAVQNLTKMARQKGYEVKAEKLAADRFRVLMTVGEGTQAEPPESGAPKEGTEACCAVAEEKRASTVVAVSSAKMGEGDEELGKALLKGFLYALSRQETLPAAVLFYNGGAAMTCEGSPCLEDLVSMAGQGVEILTCGTCLDYYGLTDKLKVGEVTNMYAIAEMLTAAGRIVKP